MKVSFDVLIFDDNDDFLYSLGLVDTAKDLQQIAGDLKAELQELKECNRWLRWAENIKNLCVKIETQKTG